MISSYVVAASSTLCSECHEISFVLTIKLSSYTYCNMFKSFRMEGTLKVVSQYFEFPPNNWYFLKKYSPFYLLLLCIFLTLFQCFFLITVFENFNGLNTWKSSFKSWQESLNYNHSQMKMFKILMVFKKRNLLLLYR